MITKLLYKGQNAFQLVIATIGSVIGFFIIIGTVQFYMDYKMMVSGGKDLISPNRIVVQKKITPLNTLSIASSDFSEKEIKDIENLDFIQEVGVFESNQYEIYASIDHKQLDLSLKLDLFFEAVEDKYLDADPTGWKWDESSEFVPVILSADFLRLYNTAFSKGKGLPVFSEEAFSLITMKIHVIGKEKRTLYKGRIIGFTEKVNSVLVPISFLKYTNEFYGDKEKQKNPTRLILTTDVNAHGELMDLLKKRGLEAGEEKLELSEQKSYLQMIITIVIIIGILIISLSVLGFIQYAQIMINKVRTEIEVLLAIGYDHLLITKKYMSLFLILLGVITILTVVIAFMAKLLLLNPLLVKNGFDPTSGFHFYTWIVAGLFPSCFYFINWLVILKNIKQLASGR